MGVEPTYSAWEADVLPINYIRIYIYFNIIMSGFQDFLFFYKILQDVLSLLFADMENITVI